MLLKGYDAYYDGYEENGKAVPGYRDLIDELSGEFPLASQSPASRSKRILSSSTAISCGSKIS